MAAAEKLSALTQGAYSAAAKETMDYGLKVMDMARSNTGDAWELARAIAAAKGPAEVIELSSVHARRQLNNLMDHHRQLWMSAQKIASAMIESGKNGSDTRK